jgi:hypothetical protein
MEPSYLEEGEVEPCHLDYASEPESFPAETYTMLTYVVIPIPGDRPVRRGGRSHPKQGRGSRKSSQKKNKSG